jgi:hypothetical protein
VKLVMTVLVRDEADIIDQHLAFHLAAGVDFVIATDHESSDGTVEILERYRRRGVLHLLHETGRRYQQSTWVTRMARIAAADFGADWVINSDADEFWWPSGGGLKDVLGAAPDRIAVVRTFVRPFLPRPADGPFHERMTVRLAPAAAINDPASSFKVNTRLVHRGSPRAVVGTGNTVVAGDAFATLTRWSPIEVFHFPIRTFEQFERKFLTHFETVGGQRGDHARAHAAARVGRLRELYDSISVDDVRLERGLARGVLAEDPRLKGALAELARTGRIEPAFRRRTSAEQAGIAADEAVLEEGELLRRSRDLDELERRVEAADRRARGLVRLRRR